MITASAFQDCVHAAALERRRFQRLKKAVQAELRVAGSEAPIRTETADVSAGGCYIEMALTLEIGTLMTLVLWLGHKKLVLDGKVVTRHMHFGNGIEFGKMSAESRNLLLYFLESEDEQPKDCEVSKFGEGLIV
jgi:c-di-GMP-binding flagellar brake protein YcgR